MEHKVNIFRLDSRRSDSVPRSAQRQVTQILSMAQYPTSGNASPSTNPLRTHKTTQKLPAFDAPSTTLCRKTLIGQLMFNSGSARYALQLQQT